MCGAVLGTAYSYSLGKYVEKLGDEVMNASAEPAQGADFGQARFAFIAILLIVLGKFRGQTGLQEITTIAGFFTYQLASLSQGLKEMNEGEPP